MVQLEGTHSIEQICANGALAAMYSFSVPNVYEIKDHRDPGSDIVGSERYWRQNFPKNGYTNCPSCTTTSTQRTGTIMTSYLAWFWLFGIIETLNFSRRLN
jgi:hypothetical protein